MLGSCDLVDTLALMVQHRARVIETEDLAFLKGNFFLLRAPHRDRPAPPGVKPDPAFRGEDLVIAGEAPAAGRGAVIHQIVAHPAITAGAALERVQLRGAGFGSFLAQQQRLAHAGVERLVVEQQIAQGVLLQVVDVDTLEVAPPFELADLSRQIAAGHFLLALV